MTRVYKKTNKISMRRAVRSLGGVFLLLGFFSLVYLFYPFVSWKFYFEPVFAATGLASPVPDSNLLTESTNVDYTDAQNWFPTYHTDANTPGVSEYFLSIPKLKIVNATVSTKDTDLTAHLVHFPGTAVPPEKGNAAIFGHSTLPQLFNPKDYKTLFANAHTLKLGDTLEVKRDDVTYTYKIISISVVDPDDTSSLKQIYTDSYVTIITCTPPGTILKRLVIKARLTAL